MADELSKIDVVDRELLEILKEEGRATWTSLGARLHLAPSSIAERVRRLEKTGVIRGYGADVDPAAIGYDVRAMVEVGLVAGADAEEFERRLSARQEVAFAAYVTGTSDYSVLVDCAGAEGLDAIVRWLRSDHAVARTESKFILRVVVS
ncbi:Lrp/AsnC family transcriptional regulator [Ilumatobacteraceae bacterium]|jgi:Lrp/AsnC family leucine-responsive transcriptional regulator|nr:Lrp/AsnC family transcriptional regulator [Ilumatobacteraceae bacterium]